MEERMLFAGAGGQGLMTLGKLFALAGLHDGKNVTWYPSYGAEVRGGTAHCHVVVSDSEIYSPLVEEATAMVVMNQPSLNRFLPRLSDDGLLVLNTSLAELGDGQSPANVIAVPATDIANELGDVRVANMAMLGALNTARRIVREKTLEKALKEFLGSKKKHFLEPNLAAYARGREAVV